jgi:hypothetical protein
MQFVSKLSSEQWAEARRMRAAGATYPQIAARVNVTAPTIGSRARREAWPCGSTAEVGQGRAASPATSSIRVRLAQRLYKVIECKIKIMELRMIKQLQAHLQSDGCDPDGTVPHAPAKDERESFAALIESINQVTEMASEPAPAADGRRRAATGAINTELTALSSDIEPDGLAAASEKDALRRDIAERLAKIFPPS